MNTERARQILESRETIPVTVDGRPVWIERLNEQAGTADVTIETPARQQETVAVEQLQEG